MAKGDKFAFFVNSNITEVYNTMSESDKRSDYYFKSGDYVYAEDMGDGWYKITGCAANNNDTLSTPLSKMSESARTGSALDSNYNLTTKYIRRVRLTKIPETYNLQDVTKMIGNTNAGYVAEQLVNNTTVNVTNDEGQTSSMTKVVIDRTNTTNVSKTYTFTNIKTTTSTNTIEAMRITDLRGIFGVPHQFTAIADPRVISNDKMLDNKYIGRIYYQHIIKLIPLLIITPGVPKFMPEATKDERMSMFQALLGGGSSDTNTSYSGKYYTMDFKYTDYFKYVNDMLRAAAVYLGISNVPLDNKPLDQYNWMFGDYASTAQNGLSSGNYSNFFAKKGFGKNCIVFYADCGQTTNDNFSNDVTQSALANTVNSLSDQAREANFLMGNAVSAMGGQYEDITGQLKKLAPNASNTGILGGVISKAKALLSGGRLVFPEIWSDSHFSRSYTCSMKLVSPSGDKLSIYLNILVPIYHILALTLARQSDEGGQTYISPFLVRCYYKGSFNVDMGIITGLSITKGAEGEWTADGLPTVADVQFEIKDLYEGMFMSEGSVISNSNSLLSNITELDYIANSCGINVNDTEENRAFTLFRTLNTKNLISDYIANDIIGAVGQTFNNFLQGIFGKF